MFSPLEIAVIVIVSVLALLLLAAFRLVYNLSASLISVIDRTLKRIESSQTTQEQYMYMLRGDVNDINKDLTAFFQVNGYRNMMTIRRQEREMAERARDPPSVGDIGI